MSPYRADTPSTAAALAVCCAAIALIPDVSRGASLERLHVREVRQQRTLHRYTGTLRFFARQPRAAHTREGRRAARRARVWVRVVRRELGDTRLERRQHLAARRTLQSSYTTPTVDACLSELIERESHWISTATNPATGAYGLPQALPGSKMASAGADWATNPQTQIRWMLGYVQRYGGSCGALAFQRANGWY